MGGQALYEYDPDSNRTKLVYPSGGTAYYTFDEVDRMAAVKAPSGNVASYEFDASGNRTKSEWGNATFSYYEFDKAERISSIRHFDDAGSPLAYFDYGRDGRGNITKIARLDGLTTYFGYDQADRLASEVWKDAAGNPIYAFAWDYDAAGNRLSGTAQGEDIAWAYNQAGAIIRRTDDSGTTYYHYDLDGNLDVLEVPGGAVTYFEHGAHGLVTKIKPLGGTEITFAYDAMLRRVRMTEGAVTTYFRHDGINLLEIATSAGSATKLTHGYTTIDGIGSVVEVDKDGALYYLHTDHRGTCYKITDANGDAVWTGLCDAWGKVLSEVGTNPSIFWYHGQAWWKIAVNGRTYHVAPTRLYDAEDGRFLSRDWALSMAKLGWHGVPQMAREYRFNPRFLDPSGGCYCFWEFDTIDFGMASRDSTNAFLGKGGAVRYDDLFRVYATARLREPIAAEAREWAEESSEKCCVLAVWIDTKSARVTTSQNVEDELTNKLKKTDSEPVPFGADPDAHEKAHYEPGQAVPLIWMHGKKAQAVTAFHNRPMWGMVNSAALLKLCSQGKDGGWEWVPPAPYLLKVPITAVMVDICREQNAQVKPGMPARPPAGKNTYEEGDWIVAEVKKTIVLKMGADFLTPLVVHKTAAGEEELKPEAGFPEGLDALPQKPATLEVIP